MRVREEGPEPGVVVAVGLDAYGETHDDGTTPWPTGLNVAIRKASDGVVLVLASGTGSWEDGVLGSRISPPLLAEALLAVLESDEHGSPYRTDRLPSPERVAAAYREAGRAFGDWSTRSYVPSCPSFGPESLAHEVVTGIVCDGSVLFASLGCVRGYVVREGRIVAASPDDSLAGELVAQGLLGAEAAARHPRGDVALRLFSALQRGESPRHDPRTVRASLRPGDLVVLVDRAVDEGLRTAPFPTRPSARATVSALLDLADPQSRGAALALRV